MIIGQFNDRLCLTMKGHRILANINCNRGIKFYNGYGEY